MTPSGAEWQCGSITPWAQWGLACPPPGRCSLISFFHTTVVYICSFSKKKGRERVHWKVGDLGGESSDCGGKTSARRNIRDLCSLGLRRDGEMHSLGYPVLWEADPKNSSWKLFREEVSDAVYRAFSSLGAGPYRLFLLQPPHILAPSILQRYPEPLPSQARWDSGGQILTVAKFCKTSHEFFWSTGDPEWNACSSVHFARMNEAKPKRKPGRRPRRSGVIAGDPRGESRSGWHQTQRVTSVLAQEGGGKRTCSRFASGGEVQETVCSLSKALHPWRGWRHPWPSRLRESWIRGWAFSSQNGLSLPSRVWGEVARGQCWKERSLAGSEKTEETY